MGVPGEVCLSVYTWTPGESPRSLFISIVLFVDFVYILYLFGGLRRVLRILKYERDDVLSVYYALVVVIPFIGFFNDFFFNSARKDSASKIFELRDVVFSITVNLEFFAEIMILLYIIYIGSDRVKEHKLSTFAKPSLAITLVLYIIQWIAQILLPSHQIFQYSSEGGAAAFWGILDSSFAAIYILLLLFSNIQKYKARLPMTENFYRYLFVMFTIKICLALGNISLVTGSRIGFCFFTVGVAGYVSSFSPVFYFMFLRKHFNMKNQIIHRMSLLEATDSN